MLNVHRVEFIALTLIAVALPTEMFAWTMGDPPGGSFRTTGQNVAGTGTCAFGGMTGVLKFGANQVMENEVAFTSTGFFPGAWSATVPPPTNGWNVSPAAPPPATGRVADHVCWVVSGGAVVASTSNHTVNP